MFAQPGALVRTPGGNVEDAAAYKAAGVGWLLFNGEWADWGRLPRNCDIARMPWGYWFHCRRGVEVSGLLSESRKAGRPIVGINVEAELSTTLNPAVIRQLVDDSGYTGDVCTIMYGWVQNSVDCKPIGHWPALLEMFPADAPYLLDPATQTVKWADCETHARQLGLKHPHCLMQVYHDGEPNWYRDVTAPRHIYTLDDATGENGPVARWTR